MSKKQKIEKEDAEKLQPKTLTVSQLVYEIDRHLVHCYNTLKATTTNKLKIDTMLICIRRILDDIIIHHTSDEVTAMLVDLLNHVQMKCHESR